MKALIAMSSFVLVAFACTSPASSGGSATVSGNIVGKPVVVRDVVGLVGTQTQDGGLTSYAAVLLSDTAGTCAAAQQGGVRAATSRGTVLEMAATTALTSFAPGTYSVGKTGLAEYFYLNSGNASGVAGSGTITFDVVSESMLSGSFDVNLAGGQRVTGTFSAPVCRGLPSESAPW